MNHVLVFGPISLDTIIEIEKFQKMVVSNKA
jgi:hypothetical protein